MSFSNSTALRLPRALLPGLLVILFGFFFFQNLTVAWVCLVVFLFLVSLWVWRKPLEDIQQTFGLVRCRSDWIIYGLMIGFALALLLRWQQGSPLLLETLVPFAMVAALIGVSEELVFRGYALGRFLESLTPLQSVVISTVLHSTYKVAIFWSFAAVDLVSLGGLTFLVGLILGYSRIRSGSLWPALISHAAFDVFVYGDRITPWWIW